MVTLTRAKTQGLQRRSVAGAVLIAMLALPVMARAEPVNPDERGSRRGEAPAVVGGPRGGGEQREARQAQAPAPAAAPQAQPQFRAPQAQAQPQPQAQAQFRGNAGYLSRGYNGNPHRGDGGNFGANPGAAMQPQRGQPAPAVNGQFVEQRGNPRGGDRNFRGDGGDRNFRGENPAYAGGNSYGGGDTYTRGGAGYGNRGRSDRGENPGYVTNGGRPDRDGRNQRDFHRDDRPANYGQWSHEWRRDNRYDWRGYRNQNREAFHIGRYYAPYRGYDYARLSIGFTLDSLFYGNSYWIYDPWQYRLPAAYGPYHWVRYYDDVVLIDTRSGQVVDVIYDFFD